MLPHLLQLLAAPGVPGLTAALPQPPPPPSRGLLLFPLPQGQPSSALGPAITQDGLRPFLTVTTPATTLIPESHSEVPVDLSLGPQFQPPQLLLLPPSHDPDPSSPCLCGPLAILSFDSVSLLLPALPHPRALCVLPLALCSSRRLQVTVGTFHARG